MRGLSVALLLVALLQTAALSQSQDATRESTFRTNVEMVLVPVLVRDSRGSSAGGLRREDFRLSDEGRPQEILQFAVERNPAINDSAAGMSPLEERLSAASLPQRFVAYVFDDLHISFDDLNQTRASLEAHLKSTPLVNTRAAVVSTSGAVITPFTADRAALLQAIRSIQPRATTRTALECPDISYYMADLIVNKSDQQAVAAAYGHLNRCSAPLPFLIGAQIVRTEAARVLQAELDKTRATVSTLENLLHRLSNLRGDRDIVMVSSGFHLTQERPEMARMLAQAIESHIVISTVNAHGVHGSRFDANALRPSHPYVAASVRVGADALIDAAEQTGGVYVGNTNDTEGALRRVAEQPEYLYVLGFTPSPTGQPGTHRKLRVTLAAKSGLSVQARRSYYVPLQLPNSLSGIRNKLHAAMFSKDDSNGLTVSVNSIFLASGTDAHTLRVTAHIEATGLEFKKSDRWNSNSLTIVYGLFNTSGELIKQITRTANLRLDEAALEKFRTQGIQLGANFQPAPGTYLARVVVFEAETGKIAAQSRLVPQPE